MELAAAELGVVDAAIVVDAMAVVEAAFDVAAEVSCLRSGSMCSDPATHAAIVASVQRKDIVLISAVGIRYPDVRREEPVKMSLKGNHSHLTTGF